MKKIVDIILIAMLCLALFGITSRIVPVALSDQSMSRREVWKLLNITVLGTMDVDIDVTVNSKNGVYIACSPNVTQYFEDVAAQAEYDDWMEWLNRSTADHHWEGMDWHVSDGSLTPITYDDIQQWGIMYMDTGNVPYSTFMGNTYMADSNLTQYSNEDDPDIISTANWDGNTIKIIDDLPINASIRTKVNVVFKIVLTEPGVYTFNITAPADVELSETSWVMGGTKTLSVPYDHTSIQDAIGDSTAGDTILVFPGTYSTTTGESFPITINVANLTIKSTDGAASTIIDGGGSWGPGVHILNNITFQGFTVKNIKTNETYGIGGVLVEGHNSTLRDNVVENVFTSTTEPAGIGIDVHAKDVQIIKNTVHDVESIGIRVRDHWKEEFPGPTGVSNNVLIENNTVYRTNNTGVLVTGYAKGVTIRNNEIYGSLKPTPYNLFVHYNSSDVTIEGNHIHDTYSNIVLGGCHNVTISSNTIANTQPHPTVPTVKGKNIYILTDYGPWVTADLLSTNITITNNDILNGGYGIRITNAGASDPTPMASSTTINFNNITGNSEYGVENTIAGEDVNARYNWWGDEKGPGNETGSTGDYISDNVDYKPWLIKPYAPGQVVPVTVMYVNPELVNLTAPALGTTFTIDVHIANVTMMYGFQFTVEWDSTLLNLAIANPHVPTPWLGVGCWINQTQTASDYSLAMAPFEAGAPTFTGSASLVSLNFQTIKDPIYPSEPKVTCGLALKVVKVVNASTYIPCIAFSGNYSCYSTMPKLLVMPSNPKARKVPTEFAVNITVTDVVNLSSFEFNFTYDQSLLKVLKVENPPYIPVPYQEPDGGSIYIKVEDIGPTINGSTTLVTITFKVMQGFAWSTQATSINCTLGFDPANHTLNLGEPIDHEVVNGTYSYVPLRGDVYLMDGVVDIYDLLFVANKFGTEPGGPPYDRADMNRDGEIDILDIILVARNFGAEV